MAATTAILMVSLMEHLRAPPLGVPDELLDGCNDGNLVGDNNNGAEVITQKPRYLWSFVKTYFKHADETKFFRNTKTMIREQPPVTRIRVSRRDNLKVQELGLSLQT